MKKLFLLFLTCTFLPLFAQPTVDGNLSDTQYITIAAKQNSNAGFGSAIDVSKIVYYPDDANSKLYLGIIGKLDTGTDNGIGIWLGFSQVSGTIAGNDLGFNGAGHYMDGQGGGSNDNFKGDFEVDYMLAMNPGNGATAVFYDAAKLNGTLTQFLGQSDQSGTATNSINSDIFSTGSMSLAFNNGGGASEGFEMSIPYSELGVTSAGTITAFAFVVSATGFFSDVTVPGTVTGGNPGFNTDFNALASTGNHFNSANFALGGSDNNPPQTTLNSMSSSPGTANITFSDNGTNDLGIVKIEVKLLNNATVEIPASSGNNFGVNDIYITTAAASVNINTTSSTVSGKAELLLTDALGNQRVWVFENF